MSDDDDELPLSLEEVQRRIRDPKTKIVPAPQDAIEDLRPYVDRILVVITELFDVSGAWVSDESCLSDFFDFFRDRSLDQQLYDQVGERLGIALDRANQDDHYIVKIALRLKHHDGRWPT